MNAPSDKYHDVDTRLFNASVRKAMEVMEAFNHGNSHQTISQLTEVTGNDRSSVQRAVYTLQKMGYLSFDPETRRYAVSVQMMDLSFAFLRADRMVEAAIPHLAALSERSGASVHLSRMVGDDIIYLLRWPVGVQQHFANLPGRRRPVFCTSGGRAMLSLWSPDRAAAFIQGCNRVAINERTKTDPDEILREISIARERGYARSDGECLVGEIALSAPVRFPGFEQGGAAIAVTFSEGIFSQDDIDQTILPALRKAAQGLSFSLAVT